MEAEGSASREAVAPDETELLGSAVSPACESVSESGAEREAVAGDEKETLALGETDLECRSDRLGEFVGTEWLSVLFSVAVAMWLGVAGTAGVSGRGVGASVSVSVSVSVSGSIGASSVSSASSASIGNKGR